MLAGQVRDLDSAAELIRRAISINSTNPSYYNNLGNVLRGQGRIEQALAAFGAALQMDPSSNVAASNALFILWYHPGYDAAAILDEHRQWSRRRARRCALRCSPRQRPRSGPAIEDRLRLA